MEEWKEYRLGDICNVINGRAYKQEELQTDGKYKVLRVGNIFQGNNWYYSDMELPSEKYCYKGDLLYAWSCGFAPYIWEGEKTIYHYHIWKLVENREKINRLFLYYYLVENTKCFLGGTHGSVMFHLTKKDMENQLLRIPTLSTQVTIASILKSLDDKIENNRRINENLEQQAQALFKSWFVDFEPFRDQPFVESELGMIPQGWKVGKLGDICVTNKRTYGANFQSRILYLDTGSVTNNNIEELKLLDPKIDKIPSRARRVITEGDIVYSSVRPNQRHFAFMYDPQSNLVASTGFIVITANWSCYRYYIYQYLTQEVIINSLHAIAEQSVSTYPSINATDITNLNVVLPPDDVIIKFAEICNSYFSIIYNNQNESSDLAKLRDTLLPKLMSGEIKV